jgi:serine protease inhibitor
VEAFAFAVALANDVAPSRRWLASQRCGSVCQFEMRMKPLIPCLIICFVLPVVARAELPRTAMSDQSQAARGNNAFAIELYGQLHKRSGNLFFSPESISTVLAMVYAGARADTAAQMVKTLHFTLPPDRLHSAMGVLLRDRNGAHDGAL